MGNSLPSARSAVISTRFPIQVPLLVPPPLANSRRCVSRNEGRIASSPSSRPSTSPRLCRNIFSAAELNLKLAHDPILFHHGEPGPAFLSADEQTLGLGADQTVATRVVQHGREGIVGIDDPAVRSH